MQLDPEEIDMLHFCLRPLAGLELSDTDRQIVSRLVMEDLITDHGKTCRRFELRIFKTGWKGMALLGKGGPGVPNIPAPLRPEIHSPEPQTETKPSPRNRQQQGLLSQFDSPVFGQNKSPE